MGLDNIPFKTVVKSNRFECQARRLREEQEGKDKMNRRLWEIIDELSENEFRTSGHLGGKLGVSEKTVRTRINELNGEIMQHGAEVVSKPRYGYYLVVTARDEWEEFLKTQNTREEGIPADSEERIDYLLALFLNREEYQKLEDLSEFLFVSPKTLSNEMKKVEYILSKFSLRIERRPHYGMRIEGTEFNKRRCILQHFFLSLKPFWEPRGEQEKLSMKIADSLKRLSVEYDVKFAETAFQNTVLYIYVSISRMKRGMYIKSNVNGFSDDRAEIRLAEELYRELKNDDWPEVTWAEICYTGIYIAGNRFLGDEMDACGNFVMSEKTDELVMRILDSIYETYHVELRNNLNLRMMLNQHMIPLGIRMKYGIPIEDWQMYQIRDKYVFAYTMAQQAASIISEEYGKEMSDNETACLAVYFELAMEEEKSKQKKKKNILLVCVSGKASSRMLIYRFRQEFKDYIESLHVCGMYDFDTYDLKDIDFIFSTVPIYKKVSVPIMEIHDFLEAGEIMEVRHLLQVGEFDFLDKYYKKKYFFSEMEAETKEEVIHKLCREIRKVTELPDDFEESVLLRESYGPTDFGNLAAIPHPCRIMTRETIIAVAVLKKEILWSTQKVQVVVLTALSEEEGDDVRKFYDVTASFLMNKEAVRSLIAEPDYENLKRQLRAINGQLEKK